MASRVGHDWRGPANCITAMNVVVTQRRMENAHNFLEPACTHCSLDNRTDGAHGALTSCCEL